MQQEFLLPMTPQRHTARERDGWVFTLTEREVALMRKPITDTPGGFQSAMREAVTRIYPDRTWRVSDSLMRKLYRMCVRHGKHGGYQQRLPMRVLGPVFATHANDFKGTWFYGRKETGDDGRIKLGKTDNPAKRLTERSTDNPRNLQEVFCIWDPTGIYERRVHRRFAAHCAGREWFYCVAEVRHFVDLCRNVSSTQELPEFA